MPEESAEEKLEKRLARLRVPPPPPPAPTAERRE